VSALKKYVLVLAGPTASGKTAMAIKLAQRFKTVIISADSRQFYREMSIGTAVPSAIQLNLAKHYFIHSCSVTEAIDVASYEQEVLKLLDKLFIKHNLVILSGGTGLYIDAVCRGLDLIPEVLPAVRDQVNQLFEKSGLPGLQKAVAELDPDYYRIVDKQNPRRLQRALEVCWQTGRTFSSYRQQKPVQRNFEVIWTAIELEKIVLHNRINQRVETMLADGLVEEARKLLPFRDLNALNTVGYKELFAYFDGKIGLEEAVEQIKANTRKYAKRQLTWFRKNKDYQWFRPDEFEKLVSYIKSLNKRL